MLLLAASCYCNCNNGSRRLNGRPRRCFIHPFVVFLAPAPSSVGATRHPALAIGVVVAEPEGMACPLQTSTTRSAGSWATIISWPTVTSWPCADVQVWVLRCVGVVEAPTRVDQPKLPADRNRRRLLDQMVYISHTDAII